MSLSPSHLVQILLPKQTGNGQPIRIEEDSIAVVEVMVEHLDRTFWRSLRERLERELAQEEIAIRAQEITRL